MEYLRVTLIDSSAWWILSFKIEISFYRNPVVLIEVTKCRNTLDTSRLWKLINILILFSTPCVRSFLKTTWTNTNSTSTLEIIMFQMKMYTSFNCPGYLKCHKQTLFFFWIIDKTDFIYETGQNLFLLFAIRNSNQNLIPCFILNFILYFKDYIVFFSDH